MSLMSEGKPGRVFWLWWTALFAIAFGAVAYPLYVIRPFRYQGSRELQAALFVARWRPYVEIAVVIAAVIVLASYWRSAGRRIGALIATLALFGVAWLSRINVYEQLMFHHYDQPFFSPAAKSELDGAEKVIAVSLGGVARAYPIRSMSYHHVVNDVVGGVPIVATY